MHVLVYYLYYLCTRYKVALRLLVCSWPAPRLTPSPNREVGGPGADHYVSAQCPFNAEGAEREIQPKNWCHRKKVETALGWGGGDGWGGVGVMGEKNDWRVTEYDNGCINEFYH